MATNSLLLVDDDEIIRSALRDLLSHKGFIVTVADNVVGALKLINSQRFDVLLTDLHMPGAGDGLTVVSAMRQVSPTTVTILLSTFLEMQAAADAIHSQTDDTLFKPMEISALTEAITTRLSRGPGSARIIENVATILDRSAPQCIYEWFEQVQAESELTKVHLTREERCSHLPQVFRDLVGRLNANQPIWTKASSSVAAAFHGVNRRRQGYSPSMLVEESRILQVSIFHILQKNLANINFSILLYQVMTIADEVDSQLRQAINCYQRVDHGCVACEGVGRLNEMRRSCHGQGSAAQEERAAESA
jgi:DNA-binding response OmpR family regulator